MHTPVLPPGLDIQLICHKRTGQLHLPLNGNLECKTMIGICLFQQVVQAQFHRASDLLLETAGNQCVCWLLCLTCPLPPLLVDLIQTRMHKNSLRWTFLDIAEVKRDHE